MNGPIYLSYEAFQDLSAGINPIMKTELTEAIKKGSIYIVRHEGITFLVVVDKQGNLLLKDE
jgi:hypothetical protein